MVRLGRLSVATLLMLAVTLGMQTRSRAAFDDTTYEATLRLGGALRVTLTYGEEPAITRVELDDAVFGGFTSSGQYLTVEASQVLYYYPPFAPTDDSFQVFVPLNLFGMVRSSVRVQGELSDGQITGTATLCAEECSEPGVLEWTATLIEVPAGDDTRQEGEFASGGTIALTLDAQHNLTSMEIDGLPIDACFPDLEPLRLRALFFHPNEKHDGGGSLLRLPTALVYVGTTIITADDGALTGTFRIRGTYETDCAVESNWWTSPAGKTTPLARPTATRAPTATPSAVQLPHAGSGAAPTTSIVWIASLLAVLGAALCGLALRRTAERRTAVSRR